MSEKRRSGLKMILATVLLIAIFASALICSLASIGVEGGEVKISGSSPEGLVSAGAPRSQIALKQMFDSMGAVRTNGNRVVYEPITEEYRSAVSERIKKGEKPVLSVNIM